MNQPRLPDLQPLRTNNSATILAGTGLWVVALVVLLIVRPGPDHQWWIWTCVSGICGGLFGLWFVRRLDRGKAPDEREPSPDTPSSAESTGPATATSPILPAPPVPPTAP
ncbi:DUF2530 domain-containing protein [Streptosporangium sp. NPDC051022]|uniref:DUF2530 domain-containing protein n=1 Tax=Streptosporangium sp. NPDC051022 TaxID=3155752 RepID=UPI0034241534